MFWNATAWITPSASPEKKATGSDSILATTAAASAGMNTPPVDTNGLTGRPFVGALSTITPAATAATIIHTSRDRRWMGIPSSMARSGFSAIARTAVPDFGAQQEPATAR